MSIRARAALPLAGVVIAVALAGCVPEPVTSPTSATPTGSAPSVSSSAPTDLSPSPSPSTTAGALALPSDCESLYSSDMLAALNAQTPPLNDPGVTMFSSQNASALEVLNSGVATLRCSWGVPSESGLATNVSIVDADQATSVQNALTADGFVCEPALSGTQCRFEKQVIDLDDNLVTTGEIHYFRGDGWVATAYIDVLPEGYTQNIADTLWG